MNDQDRFHAFCPGPAITIPGRGDGPLSGLTFAAKDVFDVAGYVTGCGNPTWAATHQAADATSPVVEALLDAGASLVGKTIADEMAFSLNGENVHFGTPVNPRAPGRLPGGSSSGSAAAVAGGAVEVALGTDTAGSVRLPAGFCGLFGIRVTHGRVPMTGVVPLAPSFDALGWFARDPEMLARVGSIFLGPVEAAPMPDRVLIVDDAFALADRRARTALAPAVDAVTAALGPPRDIILDGAGLETWVPHFRILQGWEAWRCHGDWITAARPEFGPGIADRFSWAATVTLADVEPAAAFRARVTETLDVMLRDGAVLCLPTTPAIAPQLRTPQSELEEFRSQALALSCIAGLAGLPQITLPIAEVDDCPLGLSLIGRRGADEMLLRAALEVWAMIAR